jgi:hypothetical protein
MSTHAASEFWRSQTDYPFPFTRRRRLFELNYLVPRLNRTAGKSLLDLGCGDGSLLECLLRLTDYEELYGYDLSPELLRGIDPRIRTDVFDITRPRDLPRVDATILAGVVQYVFEDDVVHDLLDRITSPVLWVRSTCSLKSEGERVSRNDYASYYRSVPHTFELLARHFVVTSVDRIYPDEIESAYGTKQFYFEARRR